MALTIIRKSAVHAHSHNPQTLPVDRLRVPVKSAGDISIEPSLIPSNIPLDSPRVNLPCNKHQRYFLDVEMNFVTRFRLGKLLEIYGEILGREVKRLEDLTSMEASKLIKEMRRRYR